MRLASVAFWAVGSVPRLSARGFAFERIRRKELRELDSYEAISLLCYTADYSKAPYAPKPWSGLVEQQELFKKVATVNNVFQAAAELQEICESNQWKFCFIGGLALQRWGEPRETVDVHLSLFAGFGKEQPFIEKLLKHFDARIPDAAVFAQNRRVLLLRSQQGVGLDIALAALPYEELMIERST